MILPIVFVTVPESSTTRLLVDSSTTFPPIELTVLPTPNTSTHVACSGASPLMVMSPVVERTVPGRAELGLNEDTARGVVRDAAERDRTAGGLDNPISEDGNRRPRGSDRSAVDGRWTTVGLYLRTQEDRHTDTL